MNIIDRFVEYVKIPTMSDPNSDTYPSSSKQIVLAKLLKEQLANLVDKVELTDTGIVYAFLNPALQFAVPEAKHNAFNC